MQWRAPDGIGLAKGMVSLTRTTAEWVDSGAALAGEVTQLLTGELETAEPIGSTAVPGLLAKPIVDVAGLIGPRGDLPWCVELLGRHGWFYRGNARDDGGHLFQLVTDSGDRLAHLHLVPVTDVQWLNWLRLRNFLREDGAARQRYEVAKAHLARQHPSDRKAYTAGKAAVIAALLADAAQR